MKSVLTKNQKKTFSKIISDSLKMRVEIRYDDEFSNGHNSFSITGEISKILDNRGFESIGCLHDEIKKYFPEFNHLIKWHHMQSNEPMHYIANSLYHAGNKDYNGLLKGEEQILSYAHFLKVNNSPLLYKLSSELLDFINSTGFNKKEWQKVEIEEIDYKGEYNLGSKFTFKGMVDNWYKCPFDNKKEAEIFLDCMVNHNVEIVKNPGMVRIGEGKERDLEGFKNCTIWEDATIKTIEQDSKILEKQLQDRLPKLIKEFKKDIETLGFIF